MPTTFCTTNTESPGRSDWPLGRTVLIANTRSRWGRSRRTIRDAVQCLRSRSIAFIFHTTRHPGYARHVAAQTASDTDTLIVCGGDGTVNEVINGLCSVPGARRPRIGIIPAGSSNDIARTLGIPLSPKAACETILAGRTRAIDLGCINRRYFAMASTVGLFATVAAESNRLRGLSGAVRYVAAALKVMAVMPDPWRMTLTTDTATYEGDFGVVLVNNMPRYGGLPFQPAADPTDGLLDVLLVPPVTRRRAVAMIPRVLRGRLADHPMVTAFRTATLTIQLDRPAPANNDGECLPQLPTEIHYTTEPAAVALLC